jgi:hypothetical protein
MARTIIHLKRRFFRQKQLTHGVKQEQGRTQLGCNRFQTEHPAYCADSNRGRIWRRNSIWRKWFSSSRDTNDHWNIHHLSRYSFCDLPSRKCQPVQIETQFCWTPLDVLIQVLDCSFEEHLPYSQTLLFLGGTFRLDDFVLVAKNKRICRALNGWILKSTCAEILDFISFITGVLLLLRWSIPNQNRQETVSIVASDRSLSDWCGSSVHSNHQSATLGNALG